MRVFDCFTFYNEFDLLEMRLEELWDVVDYFVISEANTTHQSKPKPFYLKDNFARFEKYASKIRHIMIEDMPCNSDTWVNEKFQRRELRRGLTDLRPDDIVIVGDCDEIARPEAIEAIREDTNDYDRYVLFIPIHYFKLNYMMVHPNGMHGNIVATRGRAFLDPQRERESAFPWLPKPPGSMVFLNHAGWHFSYLGKTEFAKNKIQSFAHAETNVPKIVDNLDVDKMIENKVGIGWFEGSERFAYMKMDDYYPSTILNNLDKYKDMIIQEGNLNPYDYYPDIVLTQENLMQTVNGLFLEHFRKLNK